MKKMVLIQLEMIVVVLTISLLNFMVDNPMMIQIMHVEPVINYGTILMKVMLTLKLHRRWLNRIVRDARALRVEPLLLLKKKLFSLFQ
jgi:hypothetical protein